MKRKNVILMLRIQKSGSPEVRKSGSPEVRKSGSPEVQKSGSPEVQKSSHYNEELPCDP